jgi:hypothetical protein
MSAASLICPVHLRRANASTCDNEIIVVAHSPDRFNNFFLVVRNNLDTLQVLQGISPTSIEVDNIVYYSQLEAELCHIRRVRLRGLSALPLQGFGFWTYIDRLKAITSQPPALTASNITQHRPEKTYLPSQHLISNNQTCRRMYCPGIPLICCTW